MSDSILKVGIIGCGSIARSKHIPALQKVPGVEITAFCDTDDAQLQKTTREFSGPHAQVYRDYKQLLADPSLSIVHVLTPNNSHSEIAVAALEAGKHVMCEKPMAIDAAQAKAMLDAARRTGKKLSVSYQNRFKSDVAYLKQEIQAGALGDIYFAKAYSIRRRAVPTWGVFLDKTVQGGGPLIDIGTHSLDLTLYLMDNYKPKYCVGSVYQKLKNEINTGNLWGDWDPNAFTVEDSAFGYVVMENGATIMLETSWALNAVKTGEPLYLLCGTKAGADCMDGGLRINGVHNGRQYVTTPDFSAGGVAYHTGDEGADVSVREAFSWIEAVREDKEPLVTAEQAYVVSQILEGIYTSAQTGQPFYFS